MRRHLLRNSCFYFSPPPPSSLSSSFSPFSPPPSSFSSLASRDWLAAGREWASWDPNPETSEEVLSLVSAGNESELESILSTRLEFGTAGIRGEMGAGSSRMNDLTVLQAAQGLCAHLLSEFSASDAAVRGVALGFDHRARGSLNSRRFAEITAAVCRSRGIKVWMYPDFVATPLLPFLVDARDCLAGVMVTASHNPRNDNGAFPLC